jgi:hypothetical protein
MAEIKRKSKNTPRGLAEAIEAVKGANIDSTEYEM